MKRCIHWIDDRNPDQYQLFTIWCTPQPRAVWWHRAGRSGVAKGPFPTFKRTIRGKQRSAEREFVRYTTQADTQGV